MPIYLQPIPQDISDLLKQAGYSEEDIKEILDSIMPPVVKFYTGEQDKNMFKQICHNAGIPDVMTDSMITEIKQ